MTKNVPLILPPVRPYLGEVTTKKTGEFWPIVLASVIGAAASYVVPKLLENFHSTKENEDFEEFDVED